MHAALRLLLIVALLHAQTPCGAAFGAPAPCCCHMERPDDAPPACDCGCCDVGPADSPMDVLPPADDHQPCPTKCPANCPCAVCSAGYIPLTVVTSVTLPVATAFGPPHLPADPSGGQAGHRQLPDRPPRLV